MCVAEANIAILNSLQYMSVNNYVQVFHIPGVCM